MIGETIHTLLYPLIWQTEHCTNPEQASKQPAPTGCSVGCGLQPVNQRDHPGWGPIELAYISTNTTTTTTAGWLADDRKPPPAMINSWDCIRWMSCGVQYYSLRNLSTLHFTMLHPARAVAVTNILPRLHSLSSM